MEGNNIDNRFSPNNSGRNHAINVLLPKISIGKIQPFQPSRKSRKLNKYFINDFLPFSLFKTKSAPTSGPKTPSIIIGNVNIDKSLFLCEIKMVNDIGSETMKYMQVWDNQKKEFIFTKEWFFATEIPAHNVSKIKNYSLLYFFFVGNEYFVYDAKKREFVSNLRDKTIISIKELRIVYSDMGRFIELKEEEGISVLLDTDNLIV